MTSDARMFSRKIFNSSVCVKLSERNEGKELHAQRLWETLILEADDYGRGKLIPISLRAAAFGTTPTAYAEVTNDDIEKWVQEIEETGAIVVYSNEVGERFYALTGWKVYQAGNWRRKVSLIPAPPDEKRHLFKDNPFSPNPNTAEGYTEVIHETQKGSTEVTLNRIEENRKEKKRKEEKKIKTKYRDCTYLTDEEYQRLKTEYGAKLDAILEIYDDWKSISKRGKEIKDDNRAIRNYLKDWIPEKLAKRGIVIEIPKEKPRPICKCSVCGKVFYEKVDTCDRASCFGNVEMIGSKATNDKSV